MSARSLSENQAVAVDEFLPRGLNESREIDGFPLSRDS
jgi:hypothetical protein